MVVFFVCFFPVLSVSVLFFLVVSFIPLSLPSLSFWPFFFFFSFKGFLLRVGFELDKDLKTGLPPGGKSFMGMVVLVWCVRSVGLLVACVRWVSLLRARFVLAPPSPVDPSQFSNSLLPLFFRFLYLLFIFSFLLFNLSFLKLYPKT